MDLFAYNGLYDNDSCTSDADWKIGKGSETYLIKTEFDIDNNDNEIDDSNNEDAVHLNDSLANDNNTDNEDNVVQHKKMPNTIDFVLLLKTNYNQAISSKVRIKLHNQEHYGINKKSNHESDGHLEDSQQIADENSGTRFPHTNKILQPAGSGTSTTVSIKCTSTDISNECMSTECVSTDISIESVSVNTFTSLSTESIFIDAFT